MKAKTKSRQPRAHSVRLHGGSEGCLTGESWSYENAKSRDVYIALARNGRHVVTCVVRVPR
jgi:hypothetical protein